MTDRVLLVDYGGVLTAPVRDTLREFESDHALPDGAVYRAMSRCWDGDTGGLMGGFERGEVSSDDFEAALAGFFGEDGHLVDPKGLIPRLFKSMPVVGGMWDVVARAREAGVRTGLLSNSWGTEHYPYEQLHEVFDELVISGDVGCRKPDAEIYHLTMDRFGATADQCAFVDDLHFNVAAATELGMHGVLFEELDATIDALEPFLGVALR